MYELVIIIHTLIGASLTVVMPHTYYNVNDECVVAAKQAMADINPIYNPSAMCRPRNWIDV